MGGVQITSLSLIIILNFPAIKLEMQASLTDFQRNIFDQYSDKSGSEVATEFYNFLYKYLFPSLYFSLL